MKFSIKDFFSKCDQIRRKLRIWSHLQQKPLMENFIFCAVENIVRSTLFTQSPPIKYMVQSTVPVKLTQSMSQLMPNKLLPAQL